MEITIFIAVYVFMGLMVAGMAHDDYDDIPQITVNIILSLLFWWVVIPYGLGTHLRALLHKLFKKLYGKNY